MPTGKLITLCVALFLSSALISITVRKAQAERQWSLFNLWHHTPKYAFATFLSAGDNTTTTSEDPTLLTDPSEKDGYYLSARMLAYQLLHSPTTGTNTSLPFLVFTTPSVAPHKIARLTADGATVIPVNPITSSWITPDQARWSDVLTKLRMFQQTTYSKICYLDADTLLLSRLDGVFSDPATIPHPTNDSKEALHDNEGPLPTSYALASVPDAWSYEHPIPPTNPFFNTGFVLLQPSLPLFDYYISLLSPANKEKLQDATFPDQDVLNYAHRDEGNMPWRRLEWGWNANWATGRDVEAGARSVHAKFWEGLEGEEEGLVGRWEGVRGEMRAYYRGRDDALGVGGLV